MTKMFRPTPYARDLDRKYAVGFSFDGISHETAVVMAVRAIYEICGYDEKRLGLLTIEPVFDHQFAVDVLDCVGKELGVFVAERSGLFDECVMIGSDMGANKSVPRMTWINVGCGNG